MLKGKSALVTGSVNGLGFGMAKALAEQGAKVVIHGLAPQDEGNEAANRITRETGQEAIFDGTDLSTIPAIEEMTERLEQRFGGIDILINNAVIRHYTPIPDFNPLEWEKSMAVNISAPFHLIRRLSPHMLRKGWGRIINLSSIYGARASADRIDYITSKTALLGITRAAAIEFAGTGITSNAIAPGTVPSPPIVARIKGIADLEGISVEQAERNYISVRHPTGRFVSIENVAGVVTFLCSPVGDDITGATLPIDGGWQASD